MNMELFQDRRMHAIQRKINIKKSSDNAFPQLKIQSFSIMKQRQMRQIRQFRIFQVFTEKHEETAEDRPLANFILKRKLSALNMEKNILLVNKAKMIYNNNKNHRLKTELLTLQKNQPSQKLYTEPSKQYTTISSYNIQQQLQKQERLNMKSSDERLSKVQQLTFMVKKGNNNEELIVKILSERQIWKEIQSGVPNFKWIFYKEHNNYKKMNSGMKKKAINHFQFNESITTKDCLIQNLQLYCQTKKIQLFTLTPITFIIDFDSQYCEYHIKQFLQFFNKNDPRIQSPLNHKEGAAFTFISKLQPYMSWQNSQIKKKVNFLSKPINNKVYYSKNSYLWLLKPTGLNRGRGIQLFTNIEQLQAILLKYFEQMNRKKKKQSTNKRAHKLQSISREEIHEITPEQQKGQAAENPQRQKKEDRHNFQKFTINNCSFVIQKYIQEPFLINNRKFDVRVWALVTDSLNIYFFKEGYIRTSTENFSTEDVDNYFIHLTNNAIQKHSQNYGQFQNANQLSFWALKDYMSEEEVEQIWKRIKQITLMAFSSVKKKLNPYGRKYCFEIFGLDYIIDSQKKVWLIQINENPCIECSSPLLSQLIPRMLDDAFKLTIDQYFQYKTQSKAYPVDKYDNNENLWEKLGQLLPNI